MATNNIHDHHSSVVITDENSSVLMSRGAAAQAKRIHLQDQSTEKNNNPNTMVMADITNIALSEQQEQQYSTAEKCYQNQHQQQQPLPQQQQQQSSGKPATPDTDRSHSFLSVHPSVQRFSAGKVPFALVADQGVKSVTVTGSFDAFKEHKLTPGLVDNNPFFFTAEIDIPKSGEFIYKFVVNGNFMIPDYTPEDWLYVNRDGHKYIRVAIASKKKVLDNNTDSSNHHSNPAQDKDSDIYAGLPEAINEQAQKQWQQLKSNPDHLYSSPSDSQQQPIKPSQGSETANPRGSVIKRAASKVINRFSFRTQADRDRASTSSRGVSFRSASHRGSAKAASMSVSAPVEQEEPQEILLAELSKSYESRHTFKGWGEPGIPLMRDLCAQIVEKLDKRNLTEYTPLGLEVLIEYSKSYYKLGRINQKTAAPSANASSNATADTNKSNSTNMEFMQRAQDLITRVVKAIEQKNLENKGEPGLSAEKKGSAYMQYGICVERTSPSDRKAAEKIWIEAAKYYETALNEAQNEADFTKMKTGLEHVYKNMYKNLAAQDRKQDAQKFKTAFDVLRTKQYSS